MDLEDFTEMPEYCTENLAVYSKVQTSLQPYLFGVVETTSVLPPFPVSGLVCMHLLSNTASSVGQPLDTETIAQVLWSQTHESVSPNDHVMM